MSATLVSLHDIRVSTAPPAAAAPANDGKYVRRDFLRLWNIAKTNPQANLARGFSGPECDAARKEVDRYMIALHHLHNDPKGRVRYGELCGIHNGGWCTSDAGVEKIMYTKAEKDAAQAYDSAKINGKPKAGEVEPYKPHDDTQADVKDPSSKMWPNPQPNTTPVEIVFKGQGGDPAKETWHKAHQFCWHAAAPFFVWHRPYVMMFEWLLQEHDPRHKGHTGPAALAAHYFKWEDWDGIALHPALFAAEYTMLSDEFTAQGHAQGSVIPNPLLRWYAPRTFADSTAERFANKMDNTNCTTRDVAHANTPKDFDYYWPLMNEGAGANRRFKSIQRCVSEAMNNNNAMEVLTVDVGVLDSFEFAHNKFHNRIAGGNSNVSGTMATNQSPFDPIFWLHHSNVERQLLSWQKRHKDGAEDLADELMKYVVYPWVKPSKVNFANGDFGLHTQSSDQADGTFGEWFNSFTKLPYEYDEDVTAAPRDPHVTTRHVRVGIPRKLILYADMLPSQAVTGGAEYRLLFGGEVVAETPMISGHGGSCARCQANSTFRVPFDVSYNVELQRVMMLEDAKARAGPLSKIQVSVYRGEAIGTYTPAHVTLKYALVGQDAAVEQKTIDNSVPRARLTTLLLQTAGARDQIEHHVCLGKAHRSLAIVDSMRIVIAPTAPVPTWWDFAIASDAVKSMQADIHLKEKYEVEFLPDADDTKANTFVVETVIDGPARHSVAFTSHYKGDPSGAFGAVFPPPDVEKDVKDAIVLYVAPGLDAREAAAVLAHLLGHAAGRKHSSESPAVINPRLPILYHQFTGVLPS
jgi:hypothetical protein